MTTIDDDIRGALDAEDREFLASLDHDRGMFAQMGDTLSGPLGGWAKLMFGVSIALACGMFYALWQLFHIEGTRETILWGLALLGMLTAQGFLKHWFFSRMNMITILREVKRLQLQRA